MTSLVLLNVRFCANRFVFAASDIGLYKVHKKWCADRFVSQLSAVFMDQAALHMQLLPLEVDVLSDNRLCRQQPS